MVSSLVDVKLGINPIGWSNDDLRSLGGDIPLERCLTEAREAGFVGVELGHKFPRDAAALRDVLDAHGLRCVSGWYSSDLVHRTVAEELATLEPHLDLLEKMDCEVLVWCDTAGAVHGTPQEPLSRRPALDDDRWRTLCDGLSAVGHVVADRGVPLCYHHHMGCSVQSAADIERLMNGTDDAVRLLVDTGHATYAGIDPVSLVETYGPRIGHVHCKDVRSSVLEQALEEDWPFLKAVVQGVFTVPGDGSVDFGAVLSALDGQGYAGPWLVVEAEQDPAVHDPLRMAMRGRQALAALLEAMPKQS